MLERLHRARQGPQQTAVVRDARRVDVEAVEDLPTRKGGHSRISSGPRGLEEGYHTRPAATEAAWKRAVRRGGPQMASGTAAG